MRYNVLGNTGLLVSELCLGAMTFGGKGFWEVVGKPTFDFPPVDRTRLREVLAALRKVSEASGVSVARTALAWQLTKPFVTSIIIGAKNKDQLADNLAAVNVKLDAEHVKLLDEASKLPAEYPGWMVEFQNREPRVPPANR
jgi:aryl-alcohol dehydrogenase-like predicted oxidoreductase